MSSLARMLAVLDLIEHEAVLLDADTICARLGYSRPTGYRYIAELVKAGLVARRGAACYALGPRIIELDYAIRANDPVLASSRPVMRELVAASGGDVTLATCYGEHTVTIHREAGPENLMLTYGRGRQMPLLRGALSKCLLAWLPRARLIRIHAGHGAEIRAAKLGDSWPAFRTTLARIRKDGYALSVGELDPGLMAIAAPILDIEGNVLATVAVVLRLEHYQFVNHTQLVALVQGGAHRIEMALRRPILEVKGLAELKVTRERRKPGAGK